MRSFIRANRTIRPSLGFSRSLLTTSSRTITPFALRPATLGLQNKTATNVRFYSEGPPPLTRDFVQERIVDTLSCFDKIPDASKITPEANFMTDLSMDSLDVVEALFFIEEEFGIEMPE